MKINRTTQTMDGNLAAAHVAYAFSETAAIFPITPSSPRSASSGPAAEEKLFMGNPCV